MKNSYGNNIKKIVELNPLCESFYQYFVKKIVTGTMNVYFLEI